MLVASRPVLHPALLKASHAAVGAARSTSKALQFHALRLTAKHPLASPAWALRLVSAAGATRGKNQPFGQQHPAVCAGIAVFSLVV